MAKFDETFLVKGKEEREGREVRISGKFPSKRSFMRIRKIIRSVCKRKNLLMLFPKMHFVSAILEEIRLAEVRPEEFSEKKVKVYMNFNRINEIDDSIIIHELTHIWHDRVSPVLESITKIPTRIRKALSLKQDLKKYRMVKIMDWSTLLKYLRVDISIFEMKILDEGPAMFSENIFSEKVEKEEYLGEASFDFLYEKAKKKILEFINTLNKIYGEENAHEAWTKYVDPKLGLSTLSEKMKGDYPYAVGHHMVYSIKKFDKRISLTEIAKMSHHKFIKKYEAAMLANDLEPVISFTRGRGIFDIRRILARLQIEYKEKSS